MILYAANNHLPTRSRSNTQKIPQNSFPEEYTPKSPRNSQSRSPLKIEDRLLNYQIHLNRKIEALKQSAEQEQLKELQHKPKILRKSRVLADIHEKKYYSPAKSSSPEARASENLVSPENNDIITVESIPFTRFSEKPPQKLLQNLFKGSVIAKAKDSVVQTQKPNRHFARNNCINTNIKSGETTPKVKKEILTPKSAEIYSDSTDQRLMKIKTRNLAPFQVKVSFESGIDFSKYSQRTFSNEESLNS